MLNDEVMETYKISSCRMVHFFFIIIQTLNSSWCEYEIQCARAASIPLLCVVDADKQTVRSIVDFYMESNHAYLFDEQVVVCTHRFVS